VEAYSCEWVAGLRLKGDVIEWFGFTLGSENRVEVIDIRNVRNALGTVHYHPYEHERTPIPSIDDGVNWLYHSFWEVPDELNPIFFIVFKDKHASWAMYPKPPVVRRAWQEEYDKVKNNEEASVSLNLRFLEEGKIKTGVFPLGKEDKEFPTF